ncbi:poly ubiquitin [Loa loa]|uniref:Poly ubiquitin n=1 Tax=Loa loa TaxID=7209 RepID=A0A1S0TUB8_LOALO|nr:poly ubiquitin [Loa loa]EFO20364.2 poly ubiquitin [Loa loa]
MKLYVKRVNAKGGVFTITVDSKDTVASLKGRIGGVLDLFPDAIRLLYQGHPLTNTEASLGSYGIKDSSRISVIHVPSIDTNSIVSKVLSSFLLDRCPANNLSAIAERYQIVSNLYRICCINKR